MPRPGKLDLADVDTNSLAIRACQRLQPLPHRLGATQALVKRGRDTFRTSVVSCGLGMYLIRFMGAIAAIGGPLLRAIWVGGRRIKHKQTCIFPQLKLHNCIWGALLRENKCGVLYGDGLRLPELPGSVVTSPFLF